MSDFFLLLTIEYYSSLECGLVMHVIRLIPESVFSGRPTGSSGGTISVTEAIDVRAVNCPRTAWAREIPCYRGCFLL